SPSLRPPLPTRRSPRAPRADAVRPPRLAARVRARLVPRALEHRQARIARVGGVLARALAERETRAARVRHDPLVRARVAHSRRRLRLPIFDRRRLRPRLDRAILASPGYRCG